MDDTAKLLSVLLEEAKLFRKDDTDRWKTYLEWFKGNQILADRADFQANTVSNFLFSEIQTEIPILTNQLPDVEIHSDRIEYDEHAKELARLVNRIFKRNDFQLRQVEFITYGLLFSKAYFKPTWDRYMYGGLGDVKIEVPDTRMIFLEPGKMSLRDSNYVFEARPMNKLTLYRMYPDSRSKIDSLFHKGHATPESAEPVEVITAREGRHGSAAGSPPDTTIQAMIMDVALGKPHEISPNIEFVEAWFVDERSIEDLDRARQGKDSTEKKPAFPRGRLVRFANAETFEDRPNRFPRFPYIEYSNYFIPGSPYSMSELAQSIPLQEQYNIRQNQIFDLLNYNVAPLKFYDEKAGLDVDEITNAPNEWIGVVDKDGILVVPPIPVAQATYESLLKLQRDIETMFGVREVTQGTVPGDIRSGFAIEQLQEAAQVRLRLKSRLMESAIKELTKYLIWIISEFYIPGIHYPENIDLSGLVPDLFDIEIKAGVNLPASRFAEQQFNQWAYTQGIVDELFIVENSNIQGKEALIKRMAPMWQMKQQLLLSGGTVNGQR